MYSYDRRKTAAVDKVQIFNKFSLDLTTEQVEKMCAKHYELEKGSLVFRPATTHRDTVHVDFFYKLAGKDTEKSNGVGSGTVILRAQNDGLKSLKITAFVNIDDN
jgi:hypothetical protein